MDMLAHLRRLLVYDDWANREALAAMRSASSAPPRSLKLLAHILAAQRLWYGRILEGPPRIPVWPELSLDQCAAQLDLLARDWGRYLPTLTLAGLSLPVSYRNTKGEPWTSSVGDILMHVVMHGAYHRGQIAADLRASGNEPPYTDFIHAVRQGHVR